MDGAARGQDPRGCGVPSQVSGEVKVWVCEALDVEKQNIILRYRMTSHQLRLPCLMLGNNLKAWVRLRSGEASTVNKLQLCLQPLSSQISAASEGNVLSLQMMKSQGGADPLLATDCRNHFMCHGTSY